MEMKTIALIIMLLSSVLTLVIANITPQKIKIHLIIFMNFIILLLLATLNLILYGVLVILLLEN